MFPTSPLEFLRGKYAGPGVQEWVLGLATCVLLSAHVQTRMESARLHSSTRYYFRQPWVVPLQNVSLALDVAVMLAIVAWLVWPNRRAVWEWTLMAVAVLVPPVAWAELVVALGSRNNPVFVLDSLPFRPVNNLGLLGATVFFLYMLVKQPFSKKLWVDLLAKAASGAVVVGVQFAAFQALANRLSR